MTSHETNLVRRAEKFSRANEVAHDQTRQRRFERGFLSLDRPDENGVMWDYGDCGRAMRRMFRDIDAPYREHVREQRFAAMLEYVPEEWRRMLEMVRDRVPREDVMQACGISRATYYRRVETMRRMACEKKFEIFFSLYLCGSREGRGGSWREPRETPRAKS